MVAFAFALFMPAFIISTTAGKQELEKGQARDVGETHEYLTQKNGFALPFILCCENIPRYEFRITIQY